MSTISSKLLRASLLAMLGTAPLSALACGVDPYLGEVCTFAIPYCPDNYQPADGRQLQVQQYQALYSLIGNYYGGSPNVNFNLPDLRGRVAMGTGYSDYGTVIGLGKKTGAASATLSAGNLPAHTHPASGTLAANSLSGSASLPVSGGTVSGQTITGSVTVNALNGASTATSPAQVPTATNNTIGKIGGGSPAFVAQGSTPVAVPSSHNLAVSGGSISGASAAGTVSLPANPATVPVTVGANSTVQATALPTITPNLGLTVCIATVGNYPVRPN